MQKSVSLSLFLTLKLYLSSHKLFLAYILHFLNHLSVSSIKVSKSINILALVNLYRKIMLDTVNLLNTVLPKKSKLVNAAFSDPM